MNSDYKLNEYSLRLAEEKDTRSIIDFINNKRKNSKLNLEKNLFINVMLNNYNYSSENIRYSLYNFTEEFILIEKYGIINGVIAIDIPQNLSKAATMNLIILDDFIIHKFKEIFKFTLCELDKKSIRDLTKIRVFIEENLEYSEYWIKLYEDLGFVHEVTRAFEIEHRGPIKSMSIDTDLKGV